MGNGSEKRNQHTATDKAYQYIKSAILSGKFPPGERMAEEKLAAETGMSRTPVRSALSRLASEGLIKPMGRRGYCFARDSLEEMEEVFDLRAVLEGYALRLIIPMVNDRLIESLTECVDRAQEAIDSGQRHQVFEWNTKFHDTLNDLIADKKRLYNLVCDLRKYVLRYRKDTLQYIKGAVHSIDGHRKIIYALKLGYPDLCERVMREHIMEAKADAYQTIIEDR